MKTFAYGCLACAFALFTSLDMAQAACDPAQRGLQFQKALQEAAQKDPSKMSAIQADMQALAQETAKLISEGKQDEICKRYDAMEAKLK